MPWQPHINQVHAHTQRFFFKFGYSKTPTKEIPLGVHNKYRNTNYHLREIKIPPQTYFRFYSELVIQKNDTPLQMEVRSIEQVCICLHQSIKGGHRTFSVTMSHFRGKWLMVCPLGQTEATIGYICITGQLWLAVDPFLTLPWPLTSLLQKTQVHILRSSSTQFASIFPA